MADNGVPDVPPDPNTTPKRTHSAQDQELINRINEYSLRLTAAKNNAALLALLQPRGYDAAAIDEGLSLAAAAQAAVRACEAAIADRKQARTGAQAAETAARSGFDDFRKIAQGVFKEDADAKSAVKAIGRVPTDQQKFFSFAGGAYEAAQRRPLITALTKRGYDATALQAESDRLTAMNDAIAAFRTAEDCKADATRQRNVAVKAVDRWWAEFKAVAEVCLKDYPQWKGELGL